MKTSDFELWEKLKRTVQQLPSGVSDFPLPPKLKVHRVIKTLPCVLDLHHKTLAEAYAETLNFLATHFQKGTKKVQIITGKGHAGEGAIRCEFDGWLDTSSFQAYVRKAEWTNDKGAVNLWLKKDK